MGSDSDQLSANEKAEVALIRFDEINELMRSDSDAEQHAIMNHLKGGMELHSILAKHEEELSELREDFIQAHVDEAESICALYTGFVECEKKLVHFEEEIITFQRQLADSADDMVNMQHQTIGLVRSINNRRLGSSKLSEVYTALQECDAFCDAIAHKEVDKEYLDNISELEKKLSFLSSNKELAGSAVDLETRPRLETAAMRAGDKLRKYLNKRIAELAEAENLSIIEQQQRSLEKIGENIISFLKNYNSPVASAIFQEYVKRMSEVYIRHIRISIRNFGEVCINNANSIEPIITEDDVNDLNCNRDSGSPKGNIITVLPSTTKFPVQPFPRRERSVSQHMRNFADRVLKSDRPIISGDTTIYDIILTLSSVNIQGESFTFNTEVIKKLDENNNNNNNWIWQFMKCLHLLVSLCVSECRFISNFFCSSSSEADYDEAESLSRIVLMKTIDFYKSHIIEDLTLIIERQNLLAGLRFIDIIKGYLCHLSDPVPLLLLSGIIELSKNTLTNTLHSVLANDQKSTQFLSTIRLSQFQIAPDSNKINSNKLLEDKNYSITLGPHPIIQRFSHIAGEVELLNSAFFNGSMVNGKDVLMYDSAVSNVLFRQIEIICEFITTLSKRHKNLLAQRIFAINNYFYILSTWRKLAAGLSNITSEEKLLYAAPPAHISCIETRLCNELACFVDEDSKVSGTFGYLFNFIQNAEAALGPLFFTENETKEPPSLELLPDNISASATLQAVSDFSQSWQSQLTEMCNLVSKIVNTTMGIRAASSGVNSAKELEKLILKEYTQNVLEANNKMHTIVTRLFGKNSDMHAKLTSNATVLHEVKKVLQS